MNDSATLHGRIAEKCAGQAVDWSLCFEELRTRLGDSIRFATGALVEVGPPLAASRTP